jgi:hypothetical protein
MDRLFRIILRVIIKDLVRLIKVSISLSRIHKVSDNNQPWLKQVKTSRISNLILIKVILILQDSVLIIKLRISRIHLGIRVIGIMGKAIRQDSKVSFKANNNLRLISRPVNQLLNLRIFSELTKLSNLL